MNIYNYTIKLKDDKFYFCHKKVMKVSKCMTCFDIVYLIGKNDFYEINQFEIVELEEFCYKSPYKLNKNEKNKIIKRFEYFYKNDMLYGAP